MVKAIIIDDEVHCSEALRIDLETLCPNVNILACLNSADEGLEAIKTLKPNLVFLDIEMPWMNGFEVLQKVDKIDFDVIFVTAYDQYAVRAFKFSAIDYLLKPVDEEDLINAINRVENSISSKINTDHLELLLQNLKPEKEKIDRMVLPTSEGYEFVNINEIIRCESDGNYCKIFLVDGSNLFLAKTLKEIESLLVNHAFARVHASHFISYNYIKKYIKADGGQVEMKDGKLIPISRSRKVEFLERFKNP